MDEIVRGLREAVTIDPKNARAQHLLERVYRIDSRWDDLSALLESQAESAASKEDRVLGYMRLARVLARKVKAPERAAEFYGKVIDLVPQHAEATSALVDLFTANEMWDHLVSLYDGQLAATGRGPQEAGTILQVGMVHWKMRGKPEAADPYFERLRKMEPANLC